jgi:hypothetical protein
VLVLPVSQFIVNRFGDGLGTYPEKRAKGSEGQSSSSIGPQLNKRHIG